MFFSNTIKGKWARGLVTFIISGLLTGYILGRSNAYYQAYYQKQQNQKHHFQQEQLVIWGLLGQNFTNYIRYRQRINDMTRFCQNTDEDIMSKDFKERRSYYVEMRNDSLQQLQGLFVKSKYYFSEDVTQLMDDFNEWREQYRIAYIDQQPPDECYYEWQQKIIQAMLNELPAP